MIASFNVGPVYDKNDAAKTRIVVNQGGTSSGKTYSILQLLISMACMERLHISICSINFPHLKKGALKDFIDILVNNGLYNEEMHNKTDSTFRINDSFIEFFSLDQPGKARGPRRDILFVNECNLIPYATFIQLELRTKKQIFIDYNPADEFHWIYTDIIARPDCTFIKSTYKDNPFLDPQIIKSIEALKELDPYYWQVYGLGERGQLRGTIYPTWDVIDTESIPTDIEQIYGLDFGFNSPTALVRCHLLDNRLMWVEEMIYQSYLTTPELIDLMKSIIEPQRVIYADAADPQAITELRKAGFNVKPADKSVKSGIDRVKRLKVHVTKKSINIIRENQQYKYQEHADGRILEDPLKINDHAMDAIRYAVHTHALRPSGRYSVR